jgi:hypothetical protein
MCFRQKMNEFLCRGYEARIILEEVRQNAKLTNKKQQRFLENSLRTRMLMMDQGSTGYDGWLKR